ncbi:MAG: FAD-binding oxidoreductase, partial [Clostridiales bacterium]|nr:FAD-binding oxidoreductase [Clostridiales bacterium]
MNSIWSETVKIDERPILEKDLSVDTAVIGAGRVGVLTAFLLQENGIETVVIEADRIGGGQTKNTTAKITAQHGVTYDRLIKDLGEKKAKQYAYANMQAIEEYGRIIKKYGLECQFEERPAYLYTKLSPEILRQEAEAARNLGIDAHFTTETELPFSIAGALRFNGQAVFHPLEFLKGLAERLTVYEHTKALSVQDNEIITDRGKVKAKHIVFATHFPIINVPGYYFAKMHQGRSYVIALENTPPMKGMYYGIDPDGLSFRPADEIMLLGGGGHKTGENYLGGKYSMLRAKAAEFWPQSREAACWSAQDCMTPDG